jgi:ABC-type branched-subunit amino acid transport system substrate-binding protein
VANGAKIGMKAMTIATRIAAAKPDCMMLFTLGPSVANMAVQSKQAGIPPSVKLMGQSGLSSPQLIEIGGIPAGRAFATAYKAKDGEFVAAPH